MTLHVITSLMRGQFDGEWKISQFAVMVLTDPSDSVKEITDFFRKSFNETDFATRGWELVGEPYFFEVHHGHLRQYSKYIGPEPKEEPKKPVLRLVKNN